MRSFVTLCFFLLTAARSLWAQSVTPIGVWRDHLPYDKALGVVEGNGSFYCATNECVFSYTPSTGEFQRITKVNLLNDVGITGLAWCEELGMLLVHYNNGNLDLIQGSSSHNMGDIKRSSIIGDKSIYRADIQGTMAYLACGFGIVVVDLAAREVRDTWFIGPGGTQVRVNDIAFHGDSIYAATQTGLFAAWRDAPNLAAFTNWHKRTDMGPAMANGPFNAVAHFGERLLVNYRGAVEETDTLLMLGPSNEFERFSPLYGRMSHTLEVSADGTLLVVAHKYDIHRFTLDMVEQVRQYGYAGAGVNPLQAIQGSDGAIWVADKEIGLVRGQGWDMGERYTPNGPRTANVYRLATAGGNLFVSTGGVTGTWANRYLKDGVHVYVNGEWRSYTPFNNTILAGVNDFAGAANDPLDVVIDPDDPTHAFVGGWDEGVIEFVAGVPYAIHNSTNSTLQEHVGVGAGKVNVPGLCYDLDGNLWMTNAETASPIAVRRKNGSWQSFSPGSVLGGNYLVSEILAARNGYKWVIRPRGYGLLVFNDGGTSDPGDDQYKVLNQHVGTGGLPSQDVYAIAEDLDGQIWVGTNKGIAVFYVPETIFGSDNYDAQQILIQQDGNYQYLLETEAVSVIKVDGANRKWIGTQTSGVFLVSADGQEQVHHFTVDNSPLPSNNITSIAIDGTTGEVHFGTDRGIMTYRSDATQSAMDNECASVFPNPVHPTYTGPVAITGLIRDSEVRITDISGNLVYRTTSLGGQAMWPGTDMSGNRVSTGVYLIFATDRYGTFKCNTKVLVTR
jgi:streptogramin lyase